MTEIIKPTTAAVAESDPFFIDARAGTLSADGLATTETVGIQYSANGGVTWTNLFDEGAAVALTATRPQVTLLGVGKYRCVKSATAAACGVYIAR